MQTLDQFYRSVYAPIFLHGKDKRTHSEYRRTLELVVDILDDPTIHEINLYSSKFIAELQKRGLASATIAKHCRHLNAIFKKLGPKSPKNYDALARLDYTPFFPLPKQRKKDPQLFFDSDFQSLYRAFGSQDDYPRYLPKYKRPLYWQALMCFVSVTALRRQACLGIEWSNVNIKELFVRISSTIDKKDKARFKPITQELLEKMQEIRVSESPTAKVFPWAHGNKVWYQVWNRAETLACVKLGLHDLKRFSGELALRAGASVLELQQHMDHANIKTTLEHYVRPQTRDLVDRINVPIPSSGYDDPIAELGIDARMKEASQRIDEMRLEFLKRAEVDLERLGAAIRGECWQTSSGSILRVFDERRMG